MRLLSTAAWARRGAVARDGTAALLRRVAVLLGITRARLPLAVALAMAFGLMMVMALASVLGLAFYAGTANTRQLLADRTNLLLGTLEDRVEILLEPVGRQLKVVAGEIESGDLDPARMSARRRTLQGILSATPQVVGIVFVSPDFRAYRFRSGEGPLPVEDWAGLAPIRAAFEQSTGRGGSVVWGAPAWSSELDQTVINAHVPVERDGKPAGLLFAAVTLDTMVRHVDDVSAALGQPVFVLQGRDSVVALPGLDTEVAGPSRPLPLLAESGDPVMAAMWAGADEPLGVLVGDLDGEVRLVEAAGRDWVVFYREIAGFGDQPWIVGTYQPASIAGVEVRRLWRALGLSVLCLALATAATFWLGRRMARPVERLADAAQHIQALELDEVGLLPRSHVSELDRAARAFNAMRNGLAWFETYVPRRLVRQLMENPSPDAVVSRQLEVTVLFTDIVGFSTLAEQLDATAAASLLNEHFELLAACVGETEGTVDKFLGDGMMAFWGAPVPQPNHAERAVRAALLIRDRLAQVAGSPQLRLRLGVHTGRALVGNIGARDRLNYTLVGDTVNVAQRLEQLGKEVAPEDRIVILASDAAAAHARGLCEVEPLGPRQLRGRDETVEVFRLR
ncbi:MAG TPA: adenylate/guanylate cyclase domain-containing protein [Geminicoccaceae bacterium]|nr:adenylate/guanylate cyclase domain-containing protein [Geminicoccaceae bacterium]